jgi:extracellular sulfatase Sulf
MDRQKIGFSDLLHRRRLLTLLSADDAIDRLYRSLKQRRMLDNTYIFLSSDHGYHLGQFGMAKGKSQPYETDIRVPFYALGPRVPTAKK